MKLKVEEELSEWPLEAMEGHEPESRGLKLGIIRLGRAAGKTKYALLDERDICLVEEYSFEARLEIDKNGNGARIDAFAYLFGKPRTQGTTLQELLWERHRGGIAPGYRVVHKNGVSVDNRLENLLLVHESKVPTWYKPEESQGTPSAKEQDGNNGLYWMAIAQLPPESLDDHLLRSPESSRVLLRYYNSEGELIEEEDESLSFYECRHPPCTAIEQELREFSICGRCQEARYCGINCQQRDWPSHKRICREKRRALPIHIERSPER
uniref:Zinc finger MYND domain-containing protein 19 n=1 Tax=Caligus rogercresseyi TaxID=217165 RepID=C1BPF0_CALRO|nr:Zinc finger MYND domain-containing protein 19 [Caligus rogercresseyi]ACO11562.1 Zinc finger MYND domain-containing protein 19 [Caligus rogercresseyi]